MNYQELEKSRGYVVGAADRIREKLGMIRSESDSILAINARIAFESVRVIMPESATEVFNPMPKGKK